MNDEEVRDNGIVHVLPEQRGVVEGVEGDSVRSGVISEQCIGVFTESRTTSKDLAVTSLV